MGCINNVLMENVGYDHPIAQNPAKTEAHGCGGGGLGGQLLPVLVWGGPASEALSESGLLQKNGKRPGCGSNFRLYRLDLLNTLHSR